MVCVVVGGLGGRSNRLHPGKGVRDTQQKRHPVLSHQCRVWLMHAHHSADPAERIPCVAQCWMAPNSTYTLLSCMGVSHGWRRLAQELQDTVTISSLVESSTVHKATSSLVLSRLLEHTSGLLEVRLHGLYALTNAALHPLAAQPNLRIVSLTYCTNLTTEVKQHMPASLFELHVAGCHNMYEHLEEFERYELDIHVCPTALALVEEHSLKGFRFIDPAHRAGIRKGPTRLCQCQKQQQQEEHLQPSAGYRANACCPCIANRRGLFDDRPELWHASSFDWVYWASG